MSAYRGDSDGTKYMSFLIKNDELLEKYNKNLEKVRNSFKKEFDNEPVFNEKYLKAIINSYTGKINTNVYNNKTPKERSQCIFLSAILIDSVFRTGKTIIIEECKNVVKEKRCLSILLATSKFLLILIEKILKKINIFKTFQKIFKHLKKTNKKKFYNFVILFPIYKNDK